MAKTSKIAKAPKSFKSYALNKCLIGYGVVNGIINAAIFAGHQRRRSRCDVRHARHRARPRLHRPSPRYAAVRLRRAAHPHGSAQGRFLPARCGGGAFPLVSSSYAVSILGVGALAAVVMTGAGALLSLALPAAGATVTGMMFLKGLVCALGGAVAGWFTISFVVRGQQKADEVAAAMASKTAEAAL